MKNYFVKTKNFSVRGRVRNTKSFPVSLMTEPGNSFHQLTSQVSSSYLSLFNSYDFSKDTDEMF